MAPRDTAPVMQVRARPWRQACARINTYMFRYKTKPVVLDYQRTKNAGNTRRNENTPEISDTIKQADYVIASRMYSGLIRNVEWAHANNLQPLKLVTTRKYGRE